MVNKDRITLLRSGYTLLWLGLMFAPPLVAADELQQVEHPTIDFLFSANSVSDPNREIYLEPISVWYPSGDQRSAESADDLRRQATSYFDIALAAHSLERIEEPKNDSIIVRVQFIDLTMAPVSADTLQWAQQFQFRVQPGHITVVAETRDAATGQVLMRIADLQEPGDFGKSIADEIDIALRQWSEVIVSGVLQPVRPVQIAARR